MLSAKVAAGLLSGVAATMQRMMRSFSILLAMLVSIGALGVAPALAAGPAAPGLARLRARR